jgi:hypothetical protein
MMMLFFRSIASLALLPFALGEKRPFLAQQEAAAAKHHSRRLNSINEGTGDGATSPDFDEEDSNEEDSDESESASSDGAVNTLGACVSASADILIPDDAICIMQCKKGVG